MAFTACDGHSPTEPFGARAATISGVVKDKYNNVWGGVSVGILTDQGVAGNGLTNREGRYSVSGLQPGHYRVWLQLGRTGPGSLVGEVDLHQGFNAFDIVSP